MLQFFLFQVSSTTLRSYDICDTTVGDIKESRGFISSPNYPDYTIVKNECIQRIVAPSDQIIRLWIIADMEGSIFDDE